MNTEMEDAFALGSSPILRRHHVSLRRMYLDIEESCTLDPTPVPLVTVYPGCGEFTGCEGELGPMAIAPVGSTCRPGECG